MRLKDLLELGAREGVRRHVEKRAGVMLPLAVGAMIPGIVHKALERAGSTEHALDRAPYNPMKMAATPSWEDLPESQRGEPGVPGSIPREVLLQAGFPKAGAPSLFSRIFGAAGGAGQKARGIGNAALGGLGQGSSAVGNAMLGSFGTPGKGGESTSGLKGSFSQLGASPITGVASGISGGIGEMIKRKMLGREFGEKKDPFHMGAGAAVQTFGKEMGTSGANLLRDIANKAMEAAGHAGDASAREAIIGDLKKTDSVLANADDGTLMEAYHTMTRFAPVLSTDKNAVRSFLRQAVMSGSGPDFMSIKLLADSERAVTGGNDKRAALNIGEMLPAIGRQALMGGGLGAAAGALANPDDRMHGALHGALGGAALGGLGGAVGIAGAKLHAKSQGGLPPHIDFDRDAFAGSQGRSPAVMGVPFEDRKQMWNPRANPTPGYPHQGIRDLPIGAAEVAQELGHSPFGGMPVRSQP